MNLQAAYHMLSKNEIADFRSKTLQIEKKTVQIEYFWPKSHKKDELIQNCDIILKTDKFGRSETIFIFLCNCGTFSLHFR